MPSDISDLHMTQRVKYQIVPTNGSKYLEIVWAVTEMSAELHIVITGNKASAISKSYSEDYSFSTQNMILNVN